MSQMPLLFIMSRETLLAKIKALEPCMQSYVYELETRCDPSGDVRTIADLREQVQALQVKVEELKPFAQRTVVNESDIDAFWDAINCDNKTYPEAFQILINKVINNG